jgi:hypothetical protein
VHFITRDFYIGWRIPKKKIYCFLMELDNSRKRQFTVNKTCYWISEEEEEGKETENGVGND